MDPTADAGFYVRVVRRGWRVILVAIAAGLVVGGVIYLMSPRTYVATASVLVTDTGATPTTAVGERTTGGDVNLDTEAQLLKSADVVDRVLARTGDRFSADTIASQVTVEVPANTTVLDISFSASTPEAAQLGADAFADAYLTNREEVAQESLDHLAASYDTQLKAALREQTELREELRGDIEDDLVTGIQARLQTIAARTANLSEGLVTAQSTVVTPGRVINEPALPTGPAAPRATMLILSGGALGLLAGLAVSMYRERVRPRLDDEDDVQRELQLPGLAEIRHPATGVVNLVATPQSSQSLEFGQLRRRLDLLHDDHPAGSRVVVAAVTSGAAALHAAFNLAWQYAHTGTPATIVIDGGDPPPGMAMHPVAEDSRLLRGTFTGNGVLTVTAPLVVFDLGDQPESAALVPEPSDGVTIVCLRRPSPLVSLLTMPGDVAVLLAERHHDRADVARRALRALAAGGAVHVVGVALHDHYAPPPRWVGATAPLVPKDRRIPEDADGTGAEGVEPGPPLPAPPSTGADEPGHVADDHDADDHDDHDDDHDGAAPGSRRPVSEPTRAGPSSAGPSGAGPSGAGRGRPSPLWTPAALAGARRPGGTVRLRTGGWTQRTWQC